VRAVTHALFAFAFCMGVYELAAPTKTTSALTLLSGTMAGALASIPDLDLRSPLCLIRHRSGVSHSIFTVATCALFSYVLLSRYAPLDLYITAALTSAIASHVILDSLTMSGCPLLWPLSSRRFSARLCRSDSALANALIVIFCIFMIFVVLRCG
jgi:membrane-bound metal-dependent hydrolase YbcI (DUF457 family)